MLIVLVSDRFSHIQFDDSFQLSAQPVGDVFALYDPAQSAGPLPTLLDRHDQRLMKRLERVTAA